MVNKKESIAKELAGIMKFANSFIQKVESGEGLGLKDEDKEKYKEQYKKSDAYAKIEELRKIMAEMPNKIKA